MEKYKKRTKHVGEDLVPAQKGITLIALIITIIVMLILVSVTITIAVNGGLFNYASKAGRETNEAIEAEQKLGTGTAKVNTGSQEETGTIDSIIEYYTTTANDRTGIIAENIEFSIKTTPYNDTYRFTVKEGTIWTDWEENSFFAAHMPLDGSIKVLEVGGITENPNIYGFIWDTNKRIEYNLKLDGVNVKWTDTIQPNQEYIWEEIVNL